MGDNLLAVCMSLGWATTVHKKLFGRVVQLKYMIEENFFSYLACIHWGIVRPKREFYFYCIFGLAVYLFLCRILYNRLTWSNFFPVFSSIRILTIFKNYNCKLLF